MEHSVLQSVARLIVRRFGGNLQDRAFALFHMEHSVLQSAARLIVRRFGGNLQDWAFALFHMEQPHKAPRAEGLCRRRTLCRLTERSVKKRFQQKEKEKKPFCIDNPHGLCYNINVQKRSHPFWAVSFLSQFRPLPVLGRKAAL